MKFASCMSYHREMKNVWCSSILSFLTTGVLVIIDCMVMMRRIQRRGSLFYLCARHQILVA